MPVESNRKKRASAWFYQTLYQDEKIQPRPAQSYETMPEEIRSMRMMESGVDAWRLSREAIFVREAERMADYEDDYVYDRDVIRYYPTYQSLTDRELRGYFSWRTKWRHGERRKTSLSYAFLYIYELLNRIGVRDPVDGFEKLRAFEREYGELDDGICRYLNRWLWDYVVYYRLDPVLLAERPEIAFDRNVAVLRDLGSHSDEEVYQAVLGLSAYRLDRSKLFLLQPELTETVTAAVLRRVDVHYSAHRKQSMTEDLFGPQIFTPTEMFQGAVFYERRSGLNFDYRVDELRSYQCREGRWTVSMPDAAPGRSKKLGDIVRTVDAMLREATGNCSPIQPELDAKWLRKLIAEEIHASLKAREKKNARHIEIDFGRLSGIRADAALTREKLIVDEELDREEETPSQPFDVEEEPAAEANDCPLGGEERRLLHALLYGEDLAWVREEGLLLSVLIDGINEKLFDRFGDTVLQFDAEPELIEDYVQELKEMIDP